MLDTAETSRESEGLGAFSIRRLTLLERVLYREHLLSLDGPARHMRFCHPVNDAFIEDYCRRIDWLRTTVVGCFAGDRLCGAVELIVLAGYWPRSAELAVSVRPGMQDLGIGSALAEHAMAVARNRFIGHVEMVCLPENGRMRRIAEKIGARLKSHRGQVEARIPVGLPNYLTLFEEAAAEGRAMFQAVMSGPPRSPARHAAVSA